MSFVSVDLRVKQLIYPLGDMHDPHVMVSHQTFQCGGEENVKSKSDVKSKHSVVEKFQSEPKW